MKNEDIICALFKLESLQIDCRMKRKKAVKIFHGEQSEE